MISPVHFFRVFLLLGIAALSSCDRSGIIDENKDLSGQAWHYKNRLTFDVNIDDTNRTYNLFLNVRVDNNYRYSNLFIMLHQTSPSQKITRERQELTLIDESGKWLGRGLGDLYDYQIPVWKQVRFRERGIYRFELEQNMREDTLLNIYSAGIRIEDFAKAQE